MNGSRNNLFDVAPALLRVKALGWSPAEWAERADISKPTILKFINNGILKPKTIDAILKPIGMCAWDIVRKRPLETSPPALVRRRSEKQLIPAS